MQAERQLSERDMYRLQWFSYVNEISDLDLQRRTWLNMTNRNPHWSYIEFVCSFPDEDQLHFSKNKGVLTNEEFDLLFQLERVLAAYAPPNGNEWDNEAVLADPAWRLVVEKAQNVKIRLLNLVNDPTERMHLLGEICANEGR